MGLLGRLLGRDDPSTPKALGEMTVTVAAMARDKTAELLATPVQPEEMAGLFLTYTYINLYWVNLFSRGILKERSGPYYADVRKAALTMLLHVNQARRMGIGSGMWDTLEESEREMRAMLESFHPEPGEDFKTGSLQWACGQQVAASLGRPDDSQIIHTGAIVSVTAVNALQIPARLQRLASPGCS
jgi:hypothetical protein